MAKAKPSQEPADTAPAPNTAQWRKTPQIVSLRGSREYKAWLDEFAESQRMSLAGLIDFSLAELARQRGFRIPPKR